MKTLLAILALAAASPAVAQQAATTEAAPAAATQAEGVKGLVNGMAVISSDGGRVAEIAWASKPTDYGPNQTFFTEDRYMNYRRIYGREAFVEGDTVRLRMTAAQYRARSQNPDD
ncbi:MAG: hypothetical protein EON91_05355 [Brevundimonas sp.]|uniref:hypothetical protein n=1 Tax=Brevundimonas sp. TaxID=1871086 RepID=UPI001220F84E|nr:hypothetical protein [Brevundimonas sp.]RZJ18427.1 MAG: hypothetical protein EON91_05355 [Brevundimonas sp.]